MWHFTGYSLNLLVKISFMVFSLSDLDSMRSVTELLSDMLKAVTPNDPGVCFILGQIIYDFWSYHGTTHQVYFYEHRINILLLVDGLYHIIYCIYLYLFKFFRPLKMRWSQTLSASVAPIKRRLCSLSVLPGIAAAITDLVVHVEIYGKTSSVERRDRVKPNLLNEASVDFCFKIYSCH